MSEAHIRTVIASTDLFAGLTEEQLSQVERRSSTTSLPDSDYLFHQGDPAERIYIVRKGKIRLIQVSQDGEQVILKYIASGEAFGVVAVLEGILYPVAAQAVGDTQLLSWDRQTLHALLPQFPQIYLNSMQILAKRIHDFQDVIRELATERVERRIARALIRLARQVGVKTDRGVRIDLPLSRQDLAEMTGTTLYTVSRTLRDWQAQGLVESAREQIIILYPHGLVAIAEDLQPRPQNTDSDPGI